MGCMQPSRYSFFFFEGGDGILRPRGLARAVFPLDARTDTSLACIHGAEESPPKKKKRKKKLRHVVRRSYVGLVFTWCDGVTLASYSRGSKGLPELKGCSEPIHSAQVHTMQMAEVVLTPKFGQIDGVQPNPKTP